ncbi:MAG TPA: FAD-dependent oxidoreductase [Ktedonobacteraceae bacterium]|nr:FAD-dependent oxidoreductase [Ktedonobacteraceae bacterium]
MIGAGIVGASCAFFLAQGGLKVALVEREGIASGTSGSGEGNILVSDKEPGAELALAQQGCLAWKELASILPDDFEFEEKGGVVVAETDAHLHSLTERTAALCDAGVIAHMLTSAELRELEPHLAHDITGAAYFPQDAQVQPMLASAALVKSARQHGAVLLDHTEVTAVERDGQGVISAVMTSKGRITTPRLINAAGPWSSQISALVGLDLPILPRKGHIVVTEPLPRLVHHKVFEASYSDTVSSSDAALQVSSVVEGTKSGTILLGSSRQLVGFDPTIEAHVVQAIVQRAVRYFPILASAHALRSYVGFRPFAPDHLPVIGEEPNVPGYYINTGHEGAGIGLGPISSKLLSQLILGQALDMDIAPFRPTRFKKVVLR